MFSDSIGVCYQRLYQQLYTGMRISGTELFGQRESNFFFVTNFRRNAIIGDLSASSDRK